MGHNAYLVASTADMSGNGGRAIFTNSANLTTNTEWGELLLVYKVHCYFVVAS